MQRNRCLDEFEFSNNFRRLGPAAQRELKDFMDFLLCRQYKREVIIAVFHNKLLNNLLHGLLHLIENEGLDINQIRRRVMQIKELYYLLFEKVHSHYAELIEDLDSCELVKEFGHSGFANLTDAINSNDPNRIRLEIIEFFQGFDRLSRHRSVRKIVAV